MKACLTFGDSISKLLTKHCLGFVHRKIKSIETSVGFGESIGPHINTIQCEEFDIVIASLEDTETSRRYTRCPGDELE